MSFPNLGYGRYDHAPDPDSAALLVLGDLFCGCMQWGDDGSTIIRKNRIELPCRPENAGKNPRNRKEPGFLDLLKSFKMPQWSKEEISTGPGMETPPRPIKGPYPLIEQTIPDGKKPEIPGYLLEEVIFESNRTRLWRGRRQSDGLLVLIKGSASSEQSAQELAEMRHEHEITQALKIDGVLRVRGTGGV